MSLDMHTVGPWESEGQIIKSGKITIAGWLCGISDRQPYPSILEGKANARLITTAPDGLALAKMVLTEVECYCEFDGPGGPSKGPCAHCTAKALIAKAEGKAAKA